MQATTNPSRPGDGLNYTTTYEYDSLGRTLSVTTPDGVSAPTSYAGNQTTVTDQNGNARQSVRNALGQITNVYEDPAHANYPTSYGYDGLGNLTTVTQGAQSRTFGYDSLSRLTSASNPESGTVTYAYDVMNLRSRTDNRGITTAYNSHDALNRPLQQTYSDGTPAVTYSYDAAGAANSKGQLTSVANGSSATNFTGFDAVGNVLGSTQQTAGQSYRFTYSYNLAGALVSEGYPSGRVVTTSYDGANRATGLGGVLNGVQSTYAAAATYAPHGALSTLPYGNGLTQHTWYDNRLRPGTMRSALNDQAGDTYLQLRFSWNLNSTLGSLGSDNGGPGYTNFLTFTQSYVYDYLNRLSGVSDTGGWARSFGYDQYGNMWLTGNAGAPLAGNTPVANVFTGGNQISGTGYDGAGNQTGVNGNTLVYNAENQVVSVTEPANLGGAAETLAYDGLGLRVQKSTLGGTTVYVYDAFGQLAGEYATTAPFSTPCVTCYLTADHLGSTRLVTDANANVIARHDFLPFGEELPGNSAGRNSQWAPSGDNVEQKFTGQIRDPETGLDYFNARYLGAALGRFTSPDPGNAGADLTNPQTWNGYAYVRNSPLNAVDPSGMFVNAPGEPDDPFSPCWDPYDVETDSPCWGVPPGGPPVVSSGGGGGGSRSGSGSSGSTGSSAGSLPPGSFSGGETLGLPPGVGAWGSPGIGTGDGFVGPPAAVIPCVLNPVCLGGAVTVGLGAAIIWEISPKGPISVPGDFHYTGPKIIIQRPTVTLMSKSDRLRGIPRVDQLQNSCTPGRTVEEPSTSLPGGRSIEQEYICSFGVYTVHTLISSAGKVVDMHVRPGPPKGGG